MKDTEEDLKKEGLEASKNEKVGFFERLRMGNIDDPKSEAYKRFGAGRGTAERNKGPAIPEPIPTKNSGLGIAGFGAPKEQITESRADMPVGLRSALTPQGEGEGAVAPKVVQKQTTTVKTPSKTVKQTKTAVAKPDLAKEKVGKGYEEVTERLRKAPAKPKTSELEDEAEKRDKKRKALLGTALGATAAALGASAIGKKARAGTISSDNRPSSAGTRPRLMGIDPMMEPDLERMAGEGGPNFKKGGKTKAKPVKKYASGGSVSSASSRADGCAKRGKTKGRML